MIVLDRVTVNYGDVRPLENVSANFSARTTAIMGPSGSGKSTLLQMLAGLTAPTSGALEIDGLAIGLVSWLSSGDPRVSLIHQNYRLVRFLNIEQNLRLAAELRGRTLSDTAIDQLLDDVHLKPSMRDRLPTTLSGGEQQRVAIARALGVGSRLLLADEPTGALDENNTRQVTDVLVSIASSSTCSVIVATHDPAVAERLEQEFTLSNGTLERYR